jgi:hypothetical protein
VARIREDQVTDGRCFRFGIAASAARVAVVVGGDGIRWQYDFGAVLATTPAIVRAGVPRALWRVTQRVNEDFLRE